MIFQIGFAESLDLHSNYVDKKFEMDNNYAGTLINFHHKYDEKIALIIQKHLQLTALINYFYAHMMFLPFTSNNHLFFKNIHRKLSTLVQNQNGHSYVDALGFLRIVCSVCSASKLKCHTNRFANRHTTQSQNFSAHAHVMTTSRFLFVLH